MRKFLSLPQEKQDKIVGAAMSLFGESGYKKTYISEIASNAGISKALIFHYFGSKKGLYSYLVYFTGKVVLTEAQSSRDISGKGFFERALTTIRFRLTLKNKYPAMNAFIESVYNEDDPEVTGDTERLLSIATDTHAGISLLPGEETTFGSGAPGDTIVSLISKYADGVLADYDGKTSVDEVMSDVEKCLGMLENVL